MREDIITQEDLDNFEKDLNLPDPKLTKALAALRALVEVLSHYNYKSSEIMDRVREAEELLKELE